MGLDQQELCLNFKPTHYIPKTISEFLERVSTIPNESEKLLKLDNFIKKLEDEMRKIDAFKRELPLSVVLINDAIIALKEELIKCRKTSVELKLEEFIPLKKSCDDEAQKDEVTKDKESADKKNWMSSVQLWNSTDNQNTEFIHNPKPKLPNPIVESIKAEDLYKSCKTETDGRAFVPCNGYPDFPVVTTKEDKKGLPGPGLSLLAPGTSKPREEFGADVLSSKTSISKGGSSCSPNVQSNLQTGPKPSQQQQTSRKERRCWSPELHRRFVYALQQLGGSQAATPKQIRDLMQVDGLTNDEVKSHLQKYRLHTRRAPANTTTTTTFTTLNENPCDTDGLLVPIEESSKQSRSLSRSPPGPLQLTETTGGTSTTGGDSMEVEEDEKSESYNWKHRIQTSGKDGV